MAPPGASSTIEDTQLEGAKFAKMLLGDGGEPKGNGFLAIQVGAPARMPSARGDRT